MSRRVERLFFQMLREAICSTRMKFGQSVQDLAWQISFSLLHVEMKPKKGDALLCFSLHVNATTDTCSLHGSCPVIEGAKWSATKWIHVRSFDNPQM
ncbi:hypothetical protein BS78_01G045400 [Paspalum vaginatum]|nr:hypothetical protein BS78_01G045400 [Paspalum vaginatum]